MRAATPNEIASVIRLIPLPALDTVAETLDALGLVAGKADIARARAGMGVDPKLIAIADVSRSVMAGHGWGASR